MLTKKTPDSIKGELVLSAMGERNTLLLTYRNHHPDKFSEFVKNEANLKVPEQYKGDDGKSINFINAQLCMFLVQSFDDGTDKEFPLNIDGLMSLEETWPGTLNCIIRGYHMARAANLEKNSVRR